ncbi:MAG: vWA domain-containing protein [Phycisphaerales bacterium]
MVNLAPWIALVVTLLAAIGEWLHARRVDRVARLAFGPGGRPAAWTVVVPWLRPLAAGAACWGALFLAGYDPIEIDRRPTREASKHLLICLDVSPSMQIKDSGPETEKQSRAIWAGKVVQGVLDRLDMETTRISLVAFYTDALPVLTETFDKDVVRNALDGLPMYAGFKGGATDVQMGVNKCLEIARPWPSKSATLLVVSDGDTLTSPMSSYIPDAIADTIVIGVGDPIRASIVGGHGSKQDTMSLKQLAARLGGIYHEGNTKHLPTEVLEKLTMLSPRTGLGIGLRELALTALVSGASFLALATPMLLAFGRPRSYSKARREVTVRAERHEEAAA